MKEVEVVVLILGFVACNFSLYWIGEYNRRYSFHFPLIIIVKPQIFNRLDILTISLNLILKKTEIEAHWSCKNQNSTSWNQGKSKIWTIFGAETQWKSKYLQTVPLKIGPNGIMHSKIKIFLIQKPKILEK